ncbi:hypothetical protein [Pseudomonas sivasensis]|uniref:hypothetical protein n=1 Tax=Pseudomonas sivasensis TaxID=1880678 RepID=UPI0015C45624|nr:hypothetical protein [Pseudomonas sivasensis]
MMYLQNIIRFCSPADVRCEKGQYYFDQMEFSKFIDLFRYVELVYSFSETTTFVDWDFEYLAATLDQVLEQNAITDDLEFLDFIVGRIFEVLGRNEALDALAGKLYWCLRNSDVDAACNALAGYFQQASGGENAFVGS